MINYFSNCTLYNYKYVDPIYPLNKLAKPIKNLDWILKHYNEIEFIHITYDRDKTIYQNDGILQFSLKNNRRFIARLGSIYLLLKFLDRPIFSGRIVTIDIPSIYVGKLVVGSPEYREVKNKAIPSNNA